MNFGTSLFRAARSHWICTILCSFAGIRRFIAHCNLLLGWPKILQVAIWSVHYKLNAIQPIFIPLLFTSSQYISLSLSPLSLSLYCLPSIMFFAFFHPKNLRGKVLHLFRYKYCILLIYVHLLSSIIYF